MANRSDPTITDSAPVQQSSKGIVVVVVVVVVVVSFNNSSSTYCDSTLTSLFNIGQQATSETSSPPYYQIVGDNVDLHQKACHQTMEKRDTDRHWFHLCAIKDRVTGLHLSTTPSTTNVLHLPLSTWLPTVDDCLHLRKEFIILVGRVLVKHLPKLSFLESCLPAHIPHEYSHTMTRKSQTVSF